MKTLSTVFATLFFGALGSLFATPALADLSAAVTVINAGTVSNGAFANVSASCPSGMVALSGAMDVGNVLTMQVTTLAPTYGGQIMFSRSNGTAPAPDGWYGSAKNNSGSTQDILIAVVCAPLSGVSSVITSVSVAGSAFDTANVTCPSGTVATGGGVDNSSPLTMIVTSHSPRFNTTNFRTMHQAVGTTGAPNGWYGASHQTGSSSGTMKVGVVCAPLSDITTVIASGNVNNGNYAGVLAECPSGGFILGGGVDLENVLTMSVTGSAVKYATEPQFMWQQSIGQHGVASTWIGFARNDSGSTKQIKTAAICAPIPLGPPPPAPTTDWVTVINHGTVSNGAFANVLVSCPSGLVALSGAMDVGNVLTMQVTTLAPTYGGQIMFNRSNGTAPAPDGWYGSAKNNSGSTQEIHLAVVCAPLSGVSSVITSASVAGSGFETANVTCPSGTVATGGGVDNSSPLTMIVTSHSPRFNTTNFRTMHQAVGTTGAPNGWYGASHQTGSSSGTMKVGAVCAPLSDVTTVIATGNVTDGSFGSAVADCPAGKFIFGGGVDLENVLTMSVTGSAIKYPSNPQAMWQRSTGQHGTASSWMGFARNDSGSTKAIKSAAICGSSSPTLPPPVAAGDVIEFYHGGLKHYFMTASTAEANYVRSGGAGAGWTETGFSFRAYTGGGAGSDVCRFYNPSANTHFYTSDAVECANTKNDPGWTYEGIAFNVPMPTLGGCPSGHQAVYRLYNNRYMFNDSNHRFTPSLAEYNNMIAAGWLGEGIRMCGLP